ncbi:MAG: proton-conducting transporter membrane subunit [Lachnospiraceae bacterium]|nr:proton-conducting transporter membrane subunit [Lachnospiraceae bacterium]
MSFVCNFPLFCIILTLFSGVICAVLKPHAAKVVSLGILLMNLVLNSCVLAFVLETGEPIIYMMGHYPAPWGNEIRVGVLEAVLAIAFSIVMLLSLLGGMKHIFEDAEDTKTNFYFLMVNLLFVSMLALIYTNDLFTGYVFVEINTIAACAIVMLRKKKETLVATARYLALSLLGSGMFLMGIIILYDLTGHLLMSNIYVSVQALAKSGAYAIPLEVVIALFCVGLATKSALFPFHSWLPDAHGSATSASSAILSGLVLKGYIILLIKVMYRVIGLSVFRYSKGANVLYVLGLCAMIVGSVHAMRERNIKKMIAYSSIAQIGYIYMGIGLATTAGIAAAIFQILAHAFTKPMLFCAAGGFMEVSGESKAFHRIKGAGRRNMMAGLAFAVGSMSMIGIPLFSGFVTKYLLAGAAIQASPVKMAMGLVVLAVSTMLNALYYIPALMVVFAKTDDPVVWFPDKKNRSFAFAMIVLIIFNFVLGCCSTPLMNLILKGLAMFA